MDSQKVTNILLLILTSVVIVAVFKLAQPVVLILFLAVLLAYIMDPIMMALKRVGLPLSLSVGLTGLLFLGIFFGAGTIVISNLISFGRKLPRYQNELIEWLNSLITRLDEVTQGEVSLNLTKELGRIPIGSFVVNTATTIASNISFLVLILFFAVLILAEKYHLPRKLVKVYHGHKKHTVPAILKHIDTNLRKFIVVRTLISLAVGTTSGIILFLFGVEFAIVWGLLTFLFNFIPNIGSIIAALLPFIFSFVQFPGTLTPFWILLALTLCQFVTGVLMEPKFMGDILNLSLFVVFLSMLFWGWLWGAAGVLLAVPMTTSLKIILNNIPSTTRYALLLEKLNPRKRPPRGRRRPSP